MLSVTPGLSNNSLCVQDPPVVNDTRHGVAASYHGASILQGVATRDGVNGIQAGTKDACIYYSELMHPEVKEQATLSTRMKTRKLYRLRAIVVCC